MTVRTDDEPLVEQVRSVLADHPVTLGFLFGSRARGDADAGSDVDVAVVFDDSGSGESGRRLRLGVDLALALGTDDVDVVDLRSAPPALVRTVFRDGERIVGSESDAERLHERLLDGADEESRRPAERFDDALAAIDDHLA
ncbi:MAG: nucleotidyltransferase domain-containing protein [Haloferacaceae archaeon]